MTAQRIGVGAPGGGAAHEPPGRRRHPGRDTILFVAGLGLLAAAVVAVARQGDALADAWASVRAASVLAIFALLLLPLGNWACTSGVFWILMRRFGDVGRREMAALIGAAWLLNYLPMRPGFVGRIAYHKRVNRIPIRNSLRVAVEAVLCTVAAGALLLGTIAAAARVPAWSMGTVLAIGPAACLVGALVVGPRWQHFPLATAVRWLDLAVWTARYFLAFAILGRPVSLEAAVVVAFAGQVAMLAPVQLGFREWVVGLAYALLPGAAAATVQGAGMLDQAVPGLMADVLNRGLEVALAVPLGIASSWLLWRGARGGAPR